MPQGVEPPKLGQIAPKLARRRSTVNDLSGTSSLSQIYASMFLLFVPTLVARLAWIGMKTTDTALLGHAGTQFLTASSLSDFWTSMSGVFVNDSLLGSLCGQALGAKNYDLVGIWLQVSLTLFSWVLIPVVMLWLLTGPALRILVNVDAQTAHDAGYYAMVMACCLPATMLSGRLTSFFTSQKITGPSSRTTPLALILNLVLGLQFVLGIPFSGLHFGFWACPIVTSLVEWFVAAVLLVVYCGYFKYHEKCYGPKLQEWNYLRDVFVAPVFTDGSGRFAYYDNNIHPKVWSYVRLVIPATLALASDFWRMSAIGLLAGTLGGREVAVFNASYRLAWMNLTVIGSFSSATVTQLGIALGTGDGHLSSKIRDLGIGSVGAFLSVTTFATLVYVRQLASIFSSDPEVIDLFEECRHEMGLMIFFMCFSMHFESLLIALKKTDTVFKAALIGSWGGQLPGVLLLFYFFGRTLQNVYLGIGLGYALLFVLYMLPLLRTDMKSAAENAFKENEATTPLADQ
ncbi:unnamed protein product [Durusdinium trenchii]|uniref:MATE efflux family protein n=1 Tax=Durusdinium trenchii TaxID=1381693 RepID=A0ABP0SP19_9DINO